MKAVFLVIFFLSFSLFGFSQEYVVSVKVKYGLKKAGIVQEVQVDLGEEDINHPLYGKLKNVDDKCVTFTNPDQSLDVICTEVDLMEKLFENNWELIFASKIDVLSSPYTNYIFRYKK